MDFSIANDAEDGMVSLEVLFLNKFEDKKCAHQTSMTIPFDIELQYQSNELVHSVISRVQRFVSSKVFINEYICVFFCCCVCHGN